MAIDYPLGVGPEGFRELARFYMPDEMLTYNPTYGYGVRASHNSYLQILVEQGLIGFGIFITICIYTMHLLYASARKLLQKEEPISFMALLVVGLNMSVACSMMGGLFGAQVYYEFLWWQIALASVTFSFASSLDSNAAEESPPSLTSSNNDYEGKTNYLRQFSPRKN